MNQEKGIVYNPQYKKCWYSMTKFEKYPEMATEGVKRAFLYLVWLTFLFAFVLTVGFLIKFNIVAKQGIKFFDEYFSQIQYKDGNLTIDSSDINISNRMVALIVDTNELTSEQVVKYEKKAESSRIEIVWLRQKVLFKSDEEVQEYFYKDIFDGFGINEFNKSDIIQSLQKIISSPKVYLVYGIIITVCFFIAFFIYTLFYTLILSVFGVLTALIAKIQMRYRAVFNMSVYAMTISTVLQLIYLLIKLFTDFNIKYFDLMYSAISFICLTAAIFMIKSDVIKQQMELMKVIQIKREEKQEKEEPEEEKKDEEKKEEETDKKQEDKKEGEVDPNIEGEGSNA